MEIWSHQDNQYEVQSWYCVPEGAWHYELTGTLGARPYLAIAIPDATPSGPFTPRPAQDVLVHAGGGVVPWRILEKLIGLFEGSGDLVNEQRDLSGDTTALPLTLNAWTHQGRRFEVNTFHHGDEVSWCYELYEVTPDDRSNDYLAVLIPDASPEAGPFVPMSAEQVTLTIHGDWTLPWPVFRRFLDAIRAAGDIVEASSVAEAENRRTSGRDDRCGWSPNIVVPAIAAAPLRGLPPRQEVAVGGGARVRRGHAAVPAACHQPVP